MFEQQFQQVQGLDLKGVLHKKQFEAIFDVSEFKISEGIEIDQAPSEKNIVLISVQQQESGCWDKTKSLFWQFLPLIPTLLMLKEVMLLILIGIVLVLISAPFLIFEMCLGYTFSFSVALPLALISKFIGEIFCYVLSKYFFSDFIRKFFAENETYTLLQKTSSMYPWQLSNIIRANVILPIFVINFGSGLLQINFIQFAAPALFWGLFYSSFTVYIGSQFTNVQSLINGASLLNSSDHNNQPSQMLFIFEITMAAISVLVMIFICIYSNSFFAKIKNEIKNEEILNSFQSTKASILEDN